MGESLSVLIAEPREIVRLGLVAALSSLDDAPHLRSASALAEMEAVLAGPVSIDVVVAAAALYSGAPAAGSLPPSPTRRIVLAASSRAADIETATRVRADGYLVLDEITAESFGVAVRRVVDGKLLLPESIDAHMRQRSRLRGPAKRLPPPSLTPREEDVLRLVMRGMSNKQISAELFISVSGVKRHVSSILTKFNVQSRAQVVAQALQMSRNGPYESSGSRSMAPRAAIPRPPGVPTADGDLVDAARGEGFTPPQVLRGC